MGQLKARREWGLRTPQWIHPRQKAEQPRTFDFLTLRLRRVASKFSPFTPPPVTLGNHCRTDPSDPDTSIRRPSQDALRSRYRRCHFRYLGDNPGGKKHNFAQPANGWQGLGRASLPRPRAWSVIPTRVCISRWMLGSNRIGCSCSKPSASGSAASRSIPMCRSMPA